MCRNTNSENSSELTPEEWEKIKEAVGKTPPGF